MKLSYLVSGALGSLLLAAAALADIDPPAPDPATGATPAAMPPEAAAASGNAGEAGPEDKSKEPAREEDKPAGSSPDDQEADAKG